MPFIDNFRKLLKRQTAGIDEQLAKDTKSASAHLKNRLDAHTKEIEQDLITHMEGRVAAQRERFDQLEPMTFDGTFEEVPAPLLLTSEHHHKDQPQEEPQAPASATPPPNATDEGTDEPPAPEPEQAAPVKDKRRAAPKKKSYPVKQAPEASSPATPVQTTATEPPAPEQAAPSSEIMDDAALAAAIQKQNERRTAGKRKA